MFYLKVTLWLDTEGAEGVRGEAEPEAPPRVPQTTKARRSAPQAPEPGRLRHRRATGPPRAPDVRMDVYTNVYPESRSDLGTLKSKISL